MNTTLAPSYDVLSHELWSNQTSPLTRNIILAIAGSLLLTLSAKVQIPFYPVPLTLQTLVVLLIGFTYGPKLAGATIGIYFAQGALGLPVFAGNPAVTGGYLAGFMVAAIVCGWLAQKGWDRRWATMLASMVIGNIIIYAFGATWLSTVIGFEKAIQAGVLPFLLGDAVKIVAAAVLVPAVWKQVNKH